jgi:uncharacterized membrane protein
MTDLDHRAKEPVSAALTGPYGHPFHPILVTVPIGAWVSSVVLDVASHVVDDGAVLAEAARWLLGIGVLGALAAACVGLLDFTAIPRGTPAHRTAVTHMALNVLVTVAFALDLWWRVAGGPARGATPVGPLVLSVVAAGLLAASGSLGGRLSYRYGVRVADESVQATGFTVAGAHERSPSGRHGD